MIVVSDTSAITSLLQVGRVELLARLYGEICIPEAVQKELLRTHPLLPDFLRVRQAEKRPDVQRLCAELDLGEAEAIVLAKEISAGYAYSAMKNPAAALAAWWKVWEGFRPQLTPAMRDMQEAGEALFPHMSQCLSNWCVDFRLEAINGALKDRQCGEIGIRFIHEVLARLPAEDQDLNLSGDLGMLYFSVGRDAEAEQHCQQLIRAHPDRAVGYVIQSDELVRRFRKRLVGQDQLRRGVQLLEQALAYPVKDSESFDVPARLADARELSSRTHSE